MTAIAVWIIGILFLVMFDYYLAKLVGELIRLGNILIEIKEELKNEQ